MLQIEVRGHPHPGMARVYDHDGVRGGDSAKFAAYTLRSDRGGARHQHCLTRLSPLRTNRRNLGEPGIAVSGLLAAKTVCHHPDRRATVAVYECCREVVPP